MATITTLAEFKSNLQNDFASWTNHQYMNDTYTEEPQLGRRYAFGTIFQMKAYLMGLWATLDTYYADRLVEVFDRMLAYRDDRQSEWDPTVGPSGYPEGGSLYFADVNPGAKTAAPYWHRRQSDADPDSERALILDNGINATAIMQFVDIVHRYPTTLASYITKCNTYMDDVQEMYDAWNGVGTYAGYSSWSYNHTPSGHSVAVDGMYHWDRDDGSLDDLNRPEWNQQCQFMTGQLLMYKRRPAANSDVLNKASALVDYWKKRLFLQGSGGTAWYSWPYSHSNLTQGPGAAGSASNRTQTAIDDAYGSTTYRPEDLGHATLTLEFAFYAWKHWKETGTSLGFDDTDAQRFINTFTQGMYGIDGAGTMSTVVHDDGDSSHADANDYGAGSWALWKDVDSEVATKNRAVFDVKHPDPTSDITGNKEYYNLGFTIYAENSNPPEESTNGTVSPILLLAP